MARVVHNINVPKASDEETTKSFDAGTLTVNIKPPTKLGDPAPAFSAKTLDGETIQLKDMRGKVVLMTFWASWCGASTAALPTWKPVYDEFKDKKQFEMVGFSLDKTDEALRAAVESNELGWTQCRLGDWSETSIPIDYTVTYVPTVILVGPDGKILAHGLRGPDIREEVNKVLKNP